MNEHVRVTIRSQWAEIILREHLPSGATQEVSLLKAPRGADVLVFASKGEPAPRVVTIMATDGVAVRASAG